MENSFLKERAESFLRDANFAIKEKRWSAAAFHLEQACQLYLKHYLYLKWKEFPKTHSLEKLLESIGKAYGKEKEIRKFIKETEHIIADLEQAYITSRYLPIEFKEAQVKEMVKWKNKLISLLKSL